MFSSPCCTHIITLILNSNDSFLVYQKKKKKKHRTPHSAFFISIESNHCPALLKHIPSYTASPGQMDKGMLLISELFEYSL